MKDQICIACGVKRLRDEQKKQRKAVTFHEGICCECGEFTMVTNIQHYKGGKTH